MTALRSRIEPQPGATPYEISIKSDWLYIFPCQMQLVVSLVNFNVALSILRYYVRDAWTGHGQTRDGSELF